MTDIGAMVCHLLKNPYALTQGSGLFHALGEVIVMPITVEGIDARLKATATLLAAPDSELQREMAQLRIDWLLDLRNTLTRPPVAPPITCEMDPLVDHGTD